ncbi:peptide ligase PGM1-related protein [Streptomyces lavenduligriseus]|uniref:Peptide ligase PGM1-related protein n=1 Tax=Streptomyces lavenduligriseus TaxID=67315 RepID=A0ABT0P2X6_9ACTN|nr:peptide ligase PGM1-related protein [Streptomyces lavenduligriseus]MCL3998102.1 peptide ligase PGM1-related protein [Streptomyces lavenduligriseus]
MRILIGNHIDPSIRARGDMRAWTQRLFWFARPGDLLILCCEPDAAFVDYALAHTGVKREELTILAAPAGAWNERLLDPASLTVPAFVEQVRAALGPAGVVSEVFALWPSAAVARLADVLGVADRFPGAAFFGQGGGEIGNNKANFRALAAAAGVPILPGRICRSRAEATEATDALLETSASGAVVVKQAHNGAGVGNQLLVRDPEMAVDHVGARHLHHLAPSADGIAAYWAERWPWASGEGRWPVVIEEFAPGADAVYSEHYASDDGIRATETGRLLYVGRRLSHQVVPLDGVTEPVRAALLDGGARLAQAYRSMGYRGHLSADALVLPGGRVVFTEVNAQVSGSLHIYQSIAHGIVDVTAEPARQVCEYHVPPTWAVPGFDAFVAALDELGLAYDPATRTGVIVSMPAIPLEAGAPAQFVFCIAYDPAEGHAGAFDRLDARFATVPAGTYDASQHIGTGAVSFSS